MAVIKLLMDLITPVTAPTTFGDLMETLDSVGGKSQCGKRVHMQNVAI
jgi:hypothetical protein